ncbi:bifunctional chorismate mutase/prephenate dehydrogenase [Rheinheimera salexigens]|uniref:T-protein n=1 Tax=Rheinheimera salexigens TaxID=1628148 RepID=A0A1E7Q596_9GAMM|nr:bifunctional chorismate mutase/prephenate dehydrogenase [Rheinheimera salexigens]OEY69243.1 bifunctional chorismate mutase/prephenate dehydrogenase [Rheinheimera salexigens]
MTQQKAQQALSPLRQQIDAIDSQLVALLAKRAQVTAQVGIVKQEFALPVYVPEREQALITARREQATALGVSPELVEDILRRMMRESYQTQESGFVCCGEVGAKVVIVGGDGALGQRFASLFTRSGYVVNTLGPDDWQDAEAICANAALVLMAVPITLTEQLIHKLPVLAKHCVLADITSVKAKPLAAMLAQHSGPVVGLHPMFGPDVTNLVKQVVVVCHGRDQAQYQWLLTQLNVWGAELAEKSADEHDHAMQLIQAMRHFSSLVYGVHLADEQADLAQLLQLSSPIYRLELAMVGRLFAQNAELYADIMLSSSAMTQVLQRYQQRFCQLLQLLESQDKAGLMAQFGKGQQFFGDLAEQFLQESKHLLQKAADSR